MSLTLLGLLQATPLWLSLKDRAYHTLLKQPHYLVTGVFGEPTLTTQGIYEVFNHRQILIGLEGLESSQLVGSVMLSIAGSKKDEGEINRLPLLNFSEGGVFPCLERSIWRFPVGSLVFQFLPSGNLSGRALVPVRQERMTSKNWRRRHHIYGDPGTPFQATAIVYRDPKDQICFVEEYNAQGGEAIVVSRFSLLW